MVQWLMERKKGKLFLVLMYKLWKIPVQCEIILSLIFTARSELHKVLFLSLSVTFLFVYEISPEPLNGFVPNSQGRLVWSLAWTSLNVKVRGQGHHSQKLAFFGPFGSLHVVTFGKTSLARVLFFL